MTLDEYLRQPDASAKALAAALNISEASVARIRRGEQNIGRDLIRAIVEATDGAVTADELVFIPVHAATPTATEVRDHGA